LLIFIRTLSFFSLFTSLFFFSFFFFQAEDGIRDRNVTGVQTCALPISVPGELLRAGDGAAGVLVAGAHIHQRQRGGAAPLVQRRSEERRVGKECRVRGWEYDQ